MRHIQLIPILGIDILSGGLFGLLKAREAAIQIVPLGITGLLFAVLCLVSFVSLFTLPKHRKSSALICFLCILRVVEFTLAIRSHVLKVSESLVIQAWLNAIEYVLAILLLVRIPTEYFAHIQTTYFPAYTGHLTPLKGADVLDSKHFLVEGPATIPPDQAKSPATASGGFTEIDFGAITTTSAGFSRHLTKLPRPKMKRRNDNFGEISPGSSPPDSPSPDPEEPSLKKQPLELLRPPHLLLFLEKTCVLLICVCSSILCVLVSLHIEGQVNWDSNLLVNSILTTLVWANLGLGVTLLFVQISLPLTQKITFQGYFFAVNHAHGVVLMVSLVGMIVSFTYSVSDLLLGATLVEYLPSTGANPFMSCGKAVFTQLIPLGFHFHNILSQGRYAISGGRSNVTERMRFAYFLVVANLHWMAIGHVFEESEVHPSAIALATCARAAAIAASIDFCFVIMALLSPLAHCFVQFFNLGILRLSIHQIHIHRSMAVSGCFFACLHVILHVVAWSVDPNLRTPEGVEVYRVTSIAFVTGILLVIGLVGAGITGYELSINLSAPVSSSLHLPLAGLALIAYFGHGHERIFGTPLGSYMILGTFAICLGAFVIFFFAIPAQRMEVDFRQSVFGDVIRENEDHFIMLVLKQGNSSVIPPGSFYNIYACNETSLSFTHGHPFPVYSTRNGTITFLIHCRKAKSEDHISFTQQLLVLRPDFLYTQGPFQGPASTLIQALGTLTSTAHVYLCGWNGGFANVFNILRHLKQHSHNYAIKSITTVFNRIDNTEVRRQIHAHIYDLIIDWPSTYPVSIVESTDKELQRVLFMAEKQKKQIFRNKGEVMELWREHMSDCNRWVAMKEILGEVEEEIDLTNRRRSGTFGDSGKVLYFCGSEFQQDLFGEGWTLYVETMQT